MFLYVANHVKPCPIIVHKSPCIQFCRYKKFSLTLNCNMLKKFCLTQQLRISCRSFASHWLENNLNLEIYGVRCRYLIMTMLNFLKN
ncbi:hypothetical protein BpHYR1_027859 [Brachionus plicatilis]|uniref:Uncharacterized protein n=1 Tax=Brachionus plicatilis TaxID=10195 RepID=A0A3M7SAV5_BRAPC|nr:hypothetical protein BpHYR1_027859 [Brachionus plicatilis]